MKKKIVRRSKIQLICGQAKPGASLAFLKNMALFCREFNEKTKERNGTLVNVEITVHDDNSYSYTIGNSPSTYLIKKAIGDKKEITDQQLNEIVELIISSLNTGDDDIGKAKAKKIIIGTAQSAGIKVNG